MDHFLTYADPTAILGAAILVFAVVGAAICISLGMLIDWRNQPHRVIMRRRARRYSRRPFGLHN